MATFITFKDEGIEALDHPTEPNFVRLHGTHARRLNRDWIASIQFNGEMWPEEQMRVGRVFAAAPELLAALENCVMELRQYHARYNAKCEGGCPALVYIEEAEAAIAKAKGS